MGAIGIGFAAAIAFGCAAFLTYHDKGGGWFVFAGIVALLVAGNFAK